jgi:hypothetical protein
VESALAVSDPGDTVVNMRTGEVYPVSTVPGAVIEFYGDPRDLRWGPGFAIPVPGPPYVQAVLDAIGWEVEALTWEWPKRSRNANCAPERLVAYPRRSAQSRPVQRGTGWSVPE